MTITFLTSRDEIPVEDDDVAKLLSRLERMSTIRTAIDQRDERGVRLTPAEKDELLAALEEWLMEPGGIDDLGTGFAALRYELMRDLAVPPFND
jgi:DNA-binding MarR family transcriptional regulator